MPSYFPDENEPSAGMGRYFKPKDDGEYRGRILCPFIAYMQGWKEKKPVRKFVGEEWLPGELDEFDAYKRPQQPQYCATTAVWMHYYKPPIGGGKFGLSQPINQVQVWEVRQASIRKPFRAWANPEDSLNEGFGELSSFDFILRRFPDKDKKTTYTVDRAMPAPLPDEAIRAWDEVQRKGFDLNALLLNGDPFKGDGVPF